VRVETKDALDTQDAIECLLPGLPFVENQHRITRDGRMAPISLPEPPFAFRALVLVLYR
jgi:hypothetical protein